MPTVRIKEGNHVVRENLAAHTYTVFPLGTMGTRKILRPFLISPHHKI